MITEKKVFLSVSASNQDEAFLYISEKARDLGLANNAGQVFKALKDREKEGSTGLENGFAIPHAKARVIKEPSILIVRFKKPIVDKKWETLDSSPIEVAVALLVPDEKVSKIHINLLSQVSTLLLEDDVCKILKTGSAKEIVDALDIEKRAAAEKAVMARNSDKKGSIRIKNKHIVGVSSCPAGLAHTYLAARALVKAGEKIGATVKIETRGTTGIDDEIKRADLETAHAVIIASDVRVDQTKFVGKRFYSCGTKEAIKDPVLVLTKALESKSFIKGDARRFNSDSRRDRSIRWIQDTFSEPLWLALLIIALTGITLGIIQILTQSGITNGFLSTILGGSNGGISIGGITVAGGNITGFFTFNSGFGVIQLATAIFAAFIGYRIGGRPGFGIGLIAGFFGASGGAANALGANVLGFYNPFADINGIQLVLIWPLFGALVGLSGGLLAKYIYAGIKKTKLSGFFKTLILFLTLPFVTAINILFVNYAIVYPLYLFSNLFLDFTLLSNSLFSSDNGIWILVVGVVAAIPCTYFAFKNPVIESFIKDAKTKLMEKQQRIADKQRLKYVLSNTYKHFMTGISFFLVVLTATSLLWGAIGLLAIPTVRGAFPPFLVSFLETAFSRPGGTLPTGGTWTSYSTAGIVVELINNVGFATFTLVTVILGSFIAYSIGGVVAFMPALLAATLGNNTSGFLGAVFSGFLIGFLVRYLYIGIFKAKSKIKENPKAWKWGIYAFGSFWVIPLLGFGALLVGTYFINGIIGIINESIVGAIQRFQGLGGLVGTGSVFNFNGDFFLGLIIGAMICFDLGGPINKIAVAAALAIRGNNFYSANTASLFVPLAAQAAAISVVPLGLWFSTLLFRKRYSKQEHLIVEGGATLGWVGISEGAIPMLAKDPFRMIPINVIGGALAGGIAGGFGLGAVATINSPIGIFIGVIQPVLQFPVWPFAWLFATFTGIFWVAILYAFIKKKLPKEEKEALQVEFAERRKKRMENFRNLKNVFGRGKKTAGQTN